jgi:hypothetical protein
MVELLPDCLGRAMAAQGFAGAEILLRWAEIAGPELARRSQPLQMTWPRGAEAGARRSGATLIVRVEGAFALDLQLQAPVLIERINRHLGWACVGALKPRQGRVAPPPPRRQPPPDDPAVDARLAPAVAGVDDERLAHALLRLGRGVLRGRG